MRAMQIAEAGKAPTLVDHVSPQSGDGEVTVRVTAAPITPIAKLIAAGRHYAGSAANAFIPGIDGVGRDPSGRKVYFLFPKAPFGGFAEETLVSGAMAVLVPEEIADDRAAAIATAGVASWIALTRRAPIEKGQTVLIAGATGAAGSLGIQVARYLGAGKVIAVAREADRLARLGADETIALDDGADEALRRVFDAGVDIVLDFIWGALAEQLLRAAATNRGSRTGEPRLRYVVLGMMAGGTVTLDGNMLRSSGLELLGSGVGAIAVADLLAATGEILAATPEADFQPSFRTVSLEEAPAAWGADDGERYIVVPEQGHGEHRA